MKKNTNLTTFAILTTLTILTWVAIEAYQRFRTTNYGPIPPQILLALNPSLDSKILEDIQSKRYFSDEEISNYVPTASSSARTTPTPTPSQTATPSASATNSANIATPSASSQ